MAGSRAVGAREPGQIRKEAALSETAHAPRISLAGAEDRRARPGTCFDGGCTVHYLLAVQTMTARTCPGGLSRLRPTSSLGARWPKAARRVRRRERGRTVILRPFAVGLHVTRSLGLTRRRLRLRAVLTGQRLAAAAALVIPARCFRIWSALARTRDTVTVQVA
jgi:hypothetical protein